MGLPATAPRHSARRWSHSPQSSTQALRHVKHCYCTMLQQFSTTCLMLFCSSASLFVSWQCLIKLVLFFSFLRFTCFCLPRSWAAKIFVHCMELRTKEKACFKDHFPLWFTIFSPRFEPSFTVITVPGGENISRSIERYATTALADA